MTDLPPRTPSTGGGLVVPANLGLSPREENETTHRWDTLDGVIETINNWGFKDAVEPKVEQPVVTPALLLDPDPQIYSALFVSCLDWFNYANKMKARIVSEILQLENEMEDIAAKTRKNLRLENEERKSKLSQQNIEDEITTNMRYRELKIRLQEATQLKTEINARCEELERSLRVVSRTVEMRKEEMGNGRVGENMPRRMNNKPERFGQ